MMRMGLAWPAGKSSLRQSACQNCRMKMPPGVPGRVVAMSTSAASVFAGVRGRCSTSVMIRLRAASSASVYSTLLRLQPRRLDDRPPLVDLGRAQSCERFGRVLVGLDIVETHVGHALLQL